MPQRRALYLDANQLIAYHWQAGQLSAEGQFAADSRGQEAFTQYLVKQRQSLFYLLAEVTDESFRLDAIPCLQGRDRRALLSRKMEQSLLGTPLNLALSLGREKTGRRDEKMLFAALTRPQYLEPWLSLLRAQECQLAGIYSIPLLLGTVIDDLTSRLALATPALLLETLTSGGLRQTFFINGRLHFSRLMPLPMANPEEHAIACAEEAERTYHYLAGQRHLARGSPLTTLVLAHPEALDGLRSHCRDGEKIHYEFINLLSESQRSGLKALPQDSRCEALFLHLMVKRPPRIQFAPAHERRFFHLWQIRRTLLSGGTLALLACLLFSGQLMFDGYQLSSASEQIRLQTEGHQQRYAAILKTLPPLPMSIDQLFSLIARYDSLEAHSASLEAMVSRISRALQGSPQVQINRIDWSAGLGRDEARPSTGRSEFTIISDVYAQLPDKLSGDRRALHDAIQFFSAGLRQDGAAEVHILKLPFDISSAKSLKGGNDNASGAEAGRFALRIVAKR